MWRQTSRGLVEGINDPQVQRYSRTLRELAPHDEAKARERVLGHLEEAARGGSMTWTVADLETDELLGWVALFGISPGLDAEVGYWVHPARSRPRCCHARPAGWPSGTRSSTPRTAGWACTGSRRTPRWRTPRPAASSSRPASPASGSNAGSTQLPDGTYVDTAAYDLLASRPAASYGVAGWLRPAGRAGRRRRAPRRPRPSRCSRSPRPPPLRPARRRGRWRR